MWASLTPKRGWPGDRPGHDGNFKALAYSMPSFFFSKSLTACGLALPPVYFIT